MVIFIPHLTCGIPYFNMARKLHKDSYNEWVAGEIVEKGNYDDVFMSRESELVYLNECINQIYNRFLTNGMVDRHILSETDVISIKEKIKGQSYTFSGIRGIEEEMTPDNKNFHRLSKKLKDSILSGNKESLISVYSSPHDLLIFNSLSLFIHLRIISPYRESTTISETLLPSSTMERDFYDVTMLNDFITRIHNMGDCCIGCYINLAKLLPIIDREHLLYRLGEHIASPDIRHLLRSFLNINSVQTNNSSYCYETGLIHVGALTRTLSDFYFNEFDFFLRQFGYYYNRVDYDVFIGIPINCLSNSSIDIIQHSVENNIKESLAQIKIPEENDILSSCNFFIEGESIPLFGGELRLENNQFHFSKKNE